MAEFPTATGTIHYELLEATSSAPSEPPTLTLLHNFMSSGHSAWGPLLPVLQQYYRILLPDLPGHGRSQGYPENFNFQDMARQVAALMQAEGADQGHLAGCSAGGMIAQLLVHQHLIQPHTLTLVSTTYSINPATTDNHADVTPENFKAGRNWLEATAKLHDPYHYEGYYQEVILPNFRQLTPQSRIDLPLAALHEWSLPVCIIQGAQDEFFPSFIAEQMAATLPNSELHLIPEQTHALIFRQSWKVRDIMLGFLGKHG
jgi:3-oxoadipate enol-lactonase